MLKKVAVLLAAAVFLQTTAFAAEIDVRAKGAALVEQVSGRMLYGKNENARLPMASTTKIMTGLLACQSGRLGETVTVPPEALRVEGTSMGLLPGEHITLKELAEGLMLESGNDAANTIALTLGGSMDGFGKQMNAEAFSLGLNNTHFVTPSGLDAPSHYTTALDLARLGAYAMKNPAFASIVGSKKLRVSYNGIQNGRVLVNHNRLLSDYEGAVGIKTGFTKKCGRCLVSCATRDGVTLVVCTLSDPDDWKDHKQLLDYGFSLLKSTPLAAQQANYTVNVVGGTANTVGAVCMPGAKAALKDGEAAQVTQTVEMPRFVYAPVTKGQKLGEVVFRLGSCVVARADITALQGIDYKQASQGGLWNALKRFWGRIFGR